MPPQPTTSFAAGAATSIGCLLISAMLFVDAALAQGAAGVAGPSGAGAGANAAGGLFVGIIPGILDLFGLQVAQ